MPSKPLIREYLQSDAGAIVRIHTQSQDAFEEIGLTEEFIDYISGREDFRFFIAAIDDSVIGFCGVLFYPSMGRSEIGPIAVDPAYRNLDIGKMLFEKAWEFQKMIGVRRVIAKVKSANDAAIGFFSSLGFVNEGHFREYTKKKEDVIQLVKFM